MNKPTYPVTIDTLSKLIKHKMGAFLRCRTRSEADEQACEARLRVCLS